MNRNAIKKVSVLSLAALSALALTACDGEEAVVKELEFNEIQNNGLTAGEAERYAFAGLDYSERGNIVAQLEEYMTTTNLGGIPLYENGSTVMYKTSIDKITNTSIPGFGYGILSNGVITEDLAGENNSDWKKYYHTYVSTDENSLNYWDNSGSTVGSMSGYIHGSYYSQQINDTKDGYSYEPVLANGQLEMIGVDSNGMSDTFRIEVKVGSEATYATLSENPTFAAYNNTEVVLDDYLTGIRELHNQSNDLYRGSMTLSDASSITGLAEYYDATAEGFDQETWNNVGIKAIEENNKSYLQFTLNQPATSFYARYYVNSSLYAPIPSSFVEAVGGMKSYGKFNSTSTLSPVDTTLSTGPYVMEEYVSGSHIVFKKNENFVLSDELYHIEGIHYNVLKAAATSSTAAWEEYWADKLHSVSIPSVHIASYGSHPEATKVDGSVTWKLNVNISTQEEWVKLFGTNGSIQQTAEADYWDCEPAMANTNFVNGLYHSINRLEFATNRGSVASGNILANAYIIDPELGISYNSTDAHLNAVSSKINSSTDAYGYSLTYAKTYFKKASEELIANGDYVKGDTINLDVMWFNESLITSMGVDVAKYFTDAFNSCGGGLTLKVTNLAPSADESIYDFLDYGQFDLAMGAISGNTLDPLSFLEVFKSDNSAGWTMNWGFDTSINDGSISYAGKTWSFDALYAAGTVGAVIADGEISDFGVVLQESVNDNGVRNLTFSVNTSSTTVGSVEITNLQVVGYKDGKVSTIDLTDWKVENNLLTGSFTETLEDCIVGNARIVITYKLDGVVKTRTISTTLTKYVIVS